MMSGYVDLEAVIRLFVASVTLDNEEIEADRKVIAELRDPGGPTALRHWLHRYRAFMRFTTPQRGKVCLAICDFAKDKQRLSDPLDEDQICAEFLALKRVIEPFTPVHGGKPRHVNSLCSKALWCCYPESVPIYDVNAYRSIAALSRLLQLPTTRVDKGYVAYVSQWMAVYRRLEPCFSDARQIARFGWKVRFFDRFLWHLTSDLE